jgi:hypothetical protein
MLAGYSELLKTTAVMVTNRLGDVLACTTDLRAVMGATGLLEGRPRRPLTSVSMPHPNVVMR